MPKIKSEDEKVAMLTLAVSSHISKHHSGIHKHGISLQLLEACVKNCGQKFHQELGKFKFLNEFIRMISPKVVWSSVVCE